MRAMSLTAGGIKAAQAGGDARVCLKVLKLEQQEGKKRLSAELSDGADSAAAVLSDEAFAACVAAGAAAGAVLTLTRYTAASVDGKTRLLVQACEVSAAEAAVTPAPAAKKARLDTAPPTGSPPVAAAAAARSPAGSRRVQPIESLNPYQSSWCIRVRADGKGQLRTVKTARGEMKVFSVELTDEQGTTIQATAWREAADALYPVFEDGKAYYVSNGQLKPANLKYSSCSYMYELSLNEKTAVEACEDAAMAAPVLRYEFVPFDTLGTKLNSKATVDVLGVVTAAGELGSVARKSDGASLARRDFTLLDATSRTVKLTLWNALAETDGAEIAARVAASAASGAPVVVAVKGVRVSDYNGVSLSTVARSQLALEPAELAPAAALRAWYAAGGASAPTTEAGAGFAGARGAGGGAGGGAPRATFADIQPEVLAPADAKPEWATLCGCVVHIQPDATLYYTACPEDGCNKKVVQDGAGWFCEASQKRFEHCKRRYILRFKAADATGAGWVNAFDDTARLVLGYSADELHALKEANDARYGRALREAQWRHWVMKIKTKTEEYNGEARRRITAVALSAPDYAAQCKTLLQAIAA